MLHTSVAPTTTHQNHGCDGFPVQCKLVLHPSPIGNTGVWSMRSHAVWWYRCIWGAKWKVHLSMSTFWDVLWKSANARFQNPTWKWHLIGCSKPPPSNRIATIVTYVLHQVSALETRVGVWLVQCIEPWNLWLGVKANGVTWLVHLGMRATHVHIVWWMDTGCIYLWSALYIVHKYVLVVYRRHGTCWTLTECMQYIFSYVVPLTYHIGINGAIRNNLPLIYHNGIDADMC